MEKQTIKDLGKHTFPCILANTLKKFGNNKALALVGSEPFTYNEMAEKINALAKMFQGMGLKAGSKIALYSTGRPAWGVAYFAIVNQGMIAVPMLQDFSAVEVESILDHCGVDAILVEDKLFKRISELGNKLPKIVMDMDTYTVLETPVCSKEMVGKTPADFTEVELTKIEVNEEDTASIIYTSGTTGRSKGVELTHKNLVSCALNGMYVYTPQPDDVVLSFLPISHVYEFTTGFTMMVISGCTVYYLGKPPAVTALIPAFARIKPTICLSVPLVMEKVYKSSVKKTIDSKAITRILYKIPMFRKILNKAAGKKLMATFGGRMRFFGIGGAKMDPNVEQFLHEAKFPYAPGYGLTETSPFIACSAPQNAIPGYAGDKINQVDIHIANPNSKGIGEVVVKGPNIMKGYYKDPELTKATFTTAEDSCGEGYLKTGDLGILKVIKGRTYLKLMGRSKNMILGPSGENIYPEDIEFILNQHPLVSESLVIDDGGILKALVQVDEDKFQADAETKALEELQNAEGYQAKTIVGKVAKNVAKNVINVASSVTKGAKNAPDSISKTSKEFAEEVEKQKDKLLAEIQSFVNAKVNKSSKISKIEKIHQFEKTASQKIKRYKYTKGGKPTTEEEAEEKK